MACSRLGELATGSLQKHAWKRHAQDRAASCSIAGAMDDLRRGAGRLAGSSSSRVAAGQPWRRNGHEGGRKCRPDSMTGAPA